MNDQIKVAPRRVARESRRPFGSQMQKLAYEPRLGYHRHWFNDSPGRLEQAINAGYQHVEDKEGVKVHTVVGVSATGGALTGYLMEIPEEWYKEDMARGQEQVDQIDQAVRKGAVAGKPGVDGVYVPESRGIKIRDGR